MRRVVTCLAVSVPLLVLGGPVELGSTTISFTASGSPNSIAGSWNASPFSNPTGSAVLSYAVRLLSFSTDYGSGVSSMGFGIGLPSEPADYRGLYFCDVDVNPQCVARPLVGDVGIVDSADYAWGFLTRLTGGAPYSPAGPMGISFSGGGGKATAGGEVLITAFGDAPTTVPEPASATLLGIGIGACWWAARRKKMPRPLDGAKPQQAS